MKQTNILLLAIVTMLMIACTSKKTSSTDEVLCPLGSWIKPIDGMNGFDGIEIKDGGLASSINSSTLLYETWTQNDEDLVLSGKSIGNGQTITFSNCYKVKKCDSDSLILVGGNTTLRFARKK